jgi:hypothetical protein
MILSNSILLMWPEALMVAAAVLYLIADRKLKSDEPGAVGGVRVVASIGLFSTSSLILLGTRPNLFTIIAIPVIPAPFVFGTLLVSPKRIVQWTKTKVYLDACVITSALCWTAQAIWLLTR